MVIKEADTDGLFIQQRCEAVGRKDLLDGLHFIPRGGAANLPAGDPL